MGKTNKNEAKSLKDTYSLIARKAGCSRKYVWMVLENRLGKYGKRDTELVTEIKKMAARIEEIFSE